MPDLSQDPIDGVTPAHKWNHWSPPYAKVVKRLEDRTPDIPHKIFFGSRITEMVQMFDDPGKCDLLLVSPLVASVRGRL